MSEYRHQEIESKWQDRWEEAQLFKTPTLEPGDEKAYILDMFPYPSGSGLHVGHLLGYTGSDVLARTARKLGKKVLHPMGWDAFGLPAENYAIKTGVHPTISTAKNIQEYKRQFRQTGISYDWDKEINTSSPEYYTWTQWFFSLLYERGLAYRKEGMVNWCPSCQTVLANEQVVGGRCDRCGSEVSQKNLKQWYFKITDYADRLLSDLEELDWPEHIKTMQRNWIGKSEGATIHFSLQNSDEKLAVFTTRPDTIFGATYMVLAPEHTLVESLTTAEQLARVQDYQEVTSRKTELERTFLDKEKTGVFTGSYAINPATNLPVPIWIADYVLNNYGTGAIMAVPAHDERDFQFASEYDLPIIQVIEGETLPVTAKGVLQNSGEFSGQTSEKALDGILTLIQAKKTTTYRLRDWLVSRQRFWGAPIPIIYDKDGNDHLVPMDQLPVTLPETAEFVPTGKSPLASDAEWRRYIDPTTGEEMEREADTIDGFICSSWYYLRYPTPHLSEAAFDKEMVSKWLPVDTYLGGAEHAVLHLLYARFFTKVLFDAGYVSFKEPFTSLRNQGMILGPDHNKMSKSKGNVINPDDVVSQYGADTLRVYEMFLAPFEAEKPWSTQGITGVRRFLEKLWRLQEKIIETPATELELQVINRVVKKVGADIAEMKFNTAVSSMMEAVNALTAATSVSKSTLRSLASILNPFAPHITEQMWENMGESGFVSMSAWPTVDEQYLVDSSIEYPVQINGKVRAKVIVSLEATAEQILEEIKKDAKIAEFLQGNRIVKELVIDKRLVSLVIEPLDSLN